MAILKDLQAGEVVQAVGPNETALWLYGPEAILVLSRLDSWPNVLLVDVSGHLAYNMHARTVHLRCTVRACRCHLSVSVLWILDYLEKAIQGACMQS